MKNAAKSCLLIFIGMCISVILIIGLIFGITIAFIKDSMPKVHPGSYLVLDYASPISEKPLPDFTFAGSSGQQLELLDYVNAIKNAGTDPKIKGIIINGDFTFYGSEHTYELREAVRNFKTSGKEVIAWFSRGGNSNYFFCSIANKIYMPPTNSSSLTMTGYSITQSYYKGLFEKLGVSFNVIHIGDYKGAGENFTRQNMSDELKYSYINLMDDFYYQRLQDIAKERNIDPKKLDKHLAEGSTIFLLPGQAEKLGLIDGTHTYESLLESLKDGQKKLETIGIAEYCKLTKNKTPGHMVKGKDKLAIIYAEGSIFDYNSSSGGLRGAVVGAKSFLKDIEAVKKDADIKAVIIRVNSPGGSALASELMLRGLFELGKVKPVYISMGPIAASGGYYISLGGSKIFATPYTLTGSIGVVSMIPNLKKLTDNAGVNFETVKKHSYDDMLSPFKESSEQELALLHKSMTAIYTEFTSHVIKERNIPEDKIPLIAEGRIWSGKQSIEQGLSDEIKTLSQVVDYAVQENNLPAGYITVSYPRAQTFFEMLTSGSSVSNRVVTELTELFLDSYKTQQTLSLMEFYKEYKSHPVLLFPYYPHYGGADR